MDIFTMQFDFRYKFLVVTIDANVYNYKYEKYKFDPPFLSFQAKFFLLVNQKNVL